MKQLVLSLVIGVLVLAGCNQAQPFGAELELELAANEKACWGQATKVFARTGEMGEHASGFPTPRLGLRNLARQLHEAGILDDDSMQALGAFVAEELGLSIEACGT